MGHLSNNPRARKLFAPGMKTSGDGDFKILGGGALLLLFVANGYAQSSTSSLPVASQQALIRRYCVGCHNDKLKSGSLSLAELEKTLETGEVGPSARHWEKVIQKVRVGMMPPSGLPRPDSATLSAFAASLESLVDQAAAAHPNPGRPALHRLNRTEYANSVRDMFGIQVNVASFLPPDDKSEGFDNMADVLTVSPTLMEGYVRAAGHISRLAVGDPGAGPLVETFHIPQTFSQLHHVEGTPFGTRGGLSVIHNFPVDGEYIVRSSFYFADVEFMFGADAKGEKLEVAVDGERVALLDINPAMKDVDDLRTPPIKIKAGPHRISVSFPVKHAGPVEDVLMPLRQSLADLSTGHIPGVTGLPHLRDVAIDGPYKVTGVSETISRRKIFVCRPAGSVGESGCAERIITKLARQAFRRPVNREDVASVVEIYRAGRAKGSFETGIRTVVQAILADPEFVFRFERTPAGVAPGANHRISDLELASRLAYFLWSSAPDDELITLGSQNKLSDRATLERQVRRMLADRRSEALSTTFAGQWLRLQNLKDVRLNVYLYPDFDDNLVESMKRETELFFDSILREDRSVLDLLSANYTFVNERLGEHYKIPNVMGSRFRRITWSEPNRFGLLGHGSVLTLTSMANRTSPVLRGKWVMDVILGAPPPTPPANVPALKENTSGRKILPVRERLEEHRSNANCAACHRMMDPIGFALENYDADGAWRIKDDGFPIDPSGQLFDGAKVNGPMSLREALLSHSDAFIRNFTGSLLMYGLGRVLDYPDMPVVRSIARGVAQKENRFSAIVMGIVTSAPFQMRRAEEDSAGRATKVAAAAPARR